MPTGEHLVCDISCNGHSVLAGMYRAKNIQNKARINEDPKDAMLRELQKEIEELKKQLADGSGGEEEEEEGGDGQERVRRRKKHRLG